MSVYDRLNLNRFDEREEAPSRSNFIGRALDDVRSQIPSSQQQVDTSSRGNFLRRAMDDVRSQITPPSNQNVGLGTIPMTQMTQEQINQILAGLDPSIFGYRPPAIEPEVETVETGLEDTGVSDEVVSDVADTPTNDYPFVDPETGGDIVLVVGDPTNPGPGVVVTDPETGELPPGFTEGADGPAGTVVEGPYIAPPPPSVFSEPSPTIVDGGITTATPVVDDRNLITPNVEVPEDSMTGLGSYFTAPQINQIVDPGYSRPATTDMDRLLQMQRQTYGNFLYAPTPAPAPAPSPDDTGTAPSEGDAGFGSGYVGDGYQGDGTQTYGMNPGITDLYNNPTGIQFGNTGPNVGYMGGNMGGYYTGTTPMQDITRGIMNNIYNRGYGVMDFPVFSGITSLVPSDARATIRR
jgi:hypothetical protein